MRTPFTLIFSFVAFAFLFSAPGALAGDDHLESGAPIGRYKPQSGVLVIIDTDDFKKNEPREKLPEGNAGMGQKTEPRKDGTFNAAEWANQQLRGSSQGADVNTSPSGPKLGLGVVDKGDGTIVPMLQMELPFGSGK